MSEQTTIQQLGGQLFGDGVSGALGALDKTYELAFMKAVSQASSTTDGYIADRSGNIGLLKDLAIYSVSSAISDLLAQSAATETDAKVAEILKTAAGEFQGLAGAAGDRIVQASPLAPAGATVAQAVAQALAVDDATAQALLSPTPGVEWSVYEIAGAARDIIYQPTASIAADATAESDSALLEKAQTDGINIVVDSVNSLAASLQSYATAGLDGWHAIAAHAGGAALLLASLFENGNSAGLDVNESTLFFNDTSLTDKVSQLIGSGSVDASTVQSYLSQTELAAWLVDGIDSGVTLAQFNQMVDAASASGNGAIEVQHLIDQLRGVFKDGAAPVASMDVPTMYQSVFGTVEDLQAAYPDGLKLESLVDRSAASIAASASGSQAEMLAYRYALTHLDTFAIVGADYTRFNQSGQLQFTPEYLAARPEMLAALTAANVADLPAGANGALQAPGASSTFVDASLGVTVTGSQPELGVTVFGSDAGETLIGSAGEDRLFGGDGNDTLDGRAGADELVGGAGDDTYFVDDVGDVVVEAAGEGTDTVVSSINVTLGANVENLRLTGAAATSASGNDLANSIWGNDAGNVLSGGAGDDMIDGGAGNDTLYGGAGNDTLYGSGGNDVLFGGAGNDLLVAGVGHAQLFGGDGDDTLVGGDGAVLDGGAGANTYQASGGAVIVDTGGRGKIVLSGLGSPLSGGDRVNNQPFYVSQDGQVVYRSDDDGSVDIWGNGQRITVRPGADQGGPRSRSGDGSSPLDAGVPDAPTGGKPMLGLPLRDSAGLSDPSYKAPFIAAMGVPAVRIDPLMMDLNGDGIATLGTRDVTFFDHDGNGFAELTGWVSRDDGLLVMDRDGDGRITSGRELFGDQTILQSGARATSGAEALAEWDLAANGGTGDGVIDANDAVWANLRVWRDADADGFTDAGELISLADAGISSLSLSFGTTDVADGLGNTQATLSSFTRTDGSVGAMGDYLLARDTTVSIEDNAIPVSADAAALPEVRGAGNVLDLRQAMTRDSALVKLVQAFGAASDLTVREALLDGIIYRWTGADGVDPGSRGNAMDARKLVALEKFVGMDFAGALGANPIPAAAIQVMQGYQDLREQINAKLLVQGELQSLYQSIGYSWDSTTQSVRADLSSATSQIDAALASSPAAGRALLSDFARALRGLKELSPLDYQQLRAHYAAIGTDMAIAFDTGGLTAISATAGGTRLDGTTGSDSLIGSDQGDTITAYDGADVIYGLGGDDVISGCEGDDQIFGGLGNDSLFGAVGNDVLDGGAGNDYLDGGTGNDTYVLSRGTGQDTIRDYDTTSGNSDTIRVDVGIARSDVSYWRSGNDLMVGINGTQDTLRVQDWYSALGFRVESITFADGTQVTADMLAAAHLRGSDAAEMLQGTAANDYIEGMGGADLISGGAGDDIIDGGAGNDQLYGGRYSGSAWDGAGNDTYLFGRGSGNDTIHEYDTTAGNVDTLQLVGLTMQDVTIRRDSRDYFVTINDTGETVTVADWASGSAFRIERIVFGDGAVLSGDALNAVIFGTAGDDIVKGTNDADVMYGLGGNDSLYGGLGGDTLDGGAGNDTLYGGIGGYSLNSGAGNDTYVYGKGYGNDTIYDYDTTLGNVDTVKLVGLNARDVTIGRDNANWYLTVNATGEMLRVADWGGGSAFRIERVVFADGSVLDGAALAKTPFRGTAGNDSLTATAGDDVVYGLGGNDWLYGGAGNDVLDGGAGDDLLYGGFGGYNAGSGAGNDTYVYGRGYGNDTIYDFDATAGNLDTIQLKDLNAADVTLSRDTSTFYLKVNATGETLRVADWGGGSAFRVERLVFADGTAMDSAALWATPYLGTDAGETLTGTADNEVFKAMGGNDTVNGGAGDDVISGGAGVDLLRGDDGNDVVMGDDGNDTLYGVNGNDVLDGGTGADNLLGGDGNDVYYVDNTGDRVFESAYQGNDTVMATVNHTLGNYVDNLTLLGNANLSGTGNALDNNIIGNSGNNALSGGAGNDWLSGGAGNDTLDGGAGTDVLQGGAGNDSLTEAFGNSALSGGDGNDAINASGATFIAGGRGDDQITASGTAAVVGVNRGDGDDTLRSTATRTVLSVGAGVSYADMSLKKSGSDLVVQLGSDTSVTLAGWYDSTVTKPQFLTLQVMAEAMAGFDATSSDPLLNKRVQQFDLKQLATYYDADAAANPTIDRWAVMNKLLDARLASSNTAAAGGDLAHYYANMNGLSGMSLAAAQNTAQSATFGVSDQTMTCLDALKQGAVKLG